MLLLSYLALSHDGGHVLRFHIAFHLISNEADKSGNKFVGILTKFFVKPDLSIALSCVLLATQLALSHNIQSYVI